MTPVAVRDGIATDSPVLDRPVPCGASDEPWLPQVVLDKELASEILTDPNLAWSSGVWWREARDRLVEIANLRQNWDGEDSPPTDPLLVSAVEALLWRIAGDVAFELPVPFAAPISGGGLQLHWSYRNRYLELEFTEPGIVGYLREQERTPEDWVESDEYPLSKVRLTRQLLSWVTAP